MKLLAEMRLEDEYNYNILLRMTSENFEEIFQLIKDNITKENTKLRNPAQAITITITFNRELYKSYIYEYYSSYSTMNSSKFTSFRAFVFSVLFFSITSMIFPQKFLINKTKDVKELSWMSHRVIGF